ncbi:MAG TPA: hypothetical protein VFG23_26065, partial [Polyangia bacterium]|nr:hypothetical protein [Polyangia bacterium]
MQFLRRMLEWPEATAVARLGAEVAARPGMRERDPAALRDKVRGLAALQVSAVSRGPAVLG